MCLFQYENKRDKTYVGSVRRKLWNVLQRRDVSSKMTKCIQTIYSNVRSCVKYNNLYSDLFECSIGVHQGCVLIPYLFSMFINELAQEMEASCGYGI